MSASRNLEIALKNGKGASDRPEFDTPKKNQDILTSFPDTYRTTDRYYLEDAAITVTSPSFGSTIQFEVKDTDMMVGNFYLDISYTNAAGATSCRNGWISHLLNRVETRVGGQRLTWYSGETLKYALLTQNTLVEHKKAISLMFGTATGDTGVSNNVIPLICPGSKGLITNTMNVDQKVFFPVGMAGQSLMFYITLGALATIDANSKLAISSIVLRYNRARIKDKAMIPSQTSGLKKALYSFVFPYFQEDAYAITAGSGAANTQDIKSVITQGELQCLFVSKLNVANTTANEYFKGYAMTSINLKVEGNDTWTINSTAEYKVKNMLLNKCGPETWSSLTANDAIGNYYVIPISPNYTYDFFNFGAPGINFNQSNVQLITSDDNGGAGTERLYVCAIYKGVIHIYDNKSVELKYDFSMAY